LRALNAPAGFAHRGLDVVADHNVVKVLHALVRVTLEIGGVRNLHAFLAPGDSFWLFLHKLLS